MMHKQTAFPPPVGELRKFGWIMAGMIVALFGLLLPWWLGRAWPTWPWIVSGAIALPSAVYPAALGPLYVVWMKFGSVMGRINTGIILFALYACIIVPVGLLMRLVSRDPMARKLDPNTQTYRIVRTGPTKKESLERPF